VGKGKPFYPAEKIWKKPAKKLWSRLKTEDMKNFCEMMAEMRFWLMALHFAGNAAR
jgi:hypothetical protein